MTPLLRSDPIGRSEPDPGCSDTVTLQLGIGCQVRGHFLFFFSSRINFKLVHSCETPENPDFLRNDKMVISVKIRNFPRSRMTKRTSPLESSREI